MRHLLSSGAAAFVLLVAELSGSAARPPVAEVLAKMQAFYLKTKDLKGEFKQVYIDTLYGAQRTSFGYFYVRKPGMMRWNYVKPERKSFIIDGKELWVYEPEDKQAFRNPLSTSNLSTGLTFLLGKGDLTREFQPTYSDEKLGAPDQLVLRLTPKKPTAQYIYLLLVVRSDDFSVGESVVVAKHNRNHLIFSELQRNTRLAPSLFTFRPAADVRVIDGSKLQRP